MNTTVLATLNAHRSGNVYDLFATLGFNEAATELVDPDARFKDVVIGDRSYHQDSITKVWREIGPAPTHMAAFWVEEQEQDADGWTIPARVFPLDTDLTTALDHDAEAAWGSKATNEDEEEWTRIADREVYDNGWQVLGRYGSGGRVVCVPVTKRP